MAYIAFRFDMRFAPGAIVALLHDVFLALGAMVLAQREVTLSTVAALLTIVGYAITKTLPVTVGQLVESVWRPAVAATAMMVFVRFAHADGLHPAVSLGVDIATGALVYGFSLLALWLLARRPDGMERIVLGYVASKVGWNGRR